jgi:hypothetical protein
MIQMNKTLKDLKEDERYYNKYVVKQEYERSIREEEENEFNTVEKIITAIELRNEDEQNT